MVYTKLLICIFILSLTACASLSNSAGSLQPVNTVSESDRIYHTSCSGSVEEWGSCFQKAKGKCTEGYTQLKKVESAVGGKREITFQCNH